MHPSRVAVWCAVGFVSGIGVSTQSWISFDHIVVGVVLICSVALIIYPHRTTMIVLCAFVLGMLRGQIPPPLPTLDSGQRIYGDGIVLPEPHRATSSQTFSLRTQQGKLEIVTPLTPAVATGDHVVFSCTIFPHDDTKSFFQLRLHYLLGRCWSDDVRVITASPTAIRTLFLFKANVMRKLLTFVPPPEGFVLHSILFGSGWVVPPSIMADFRLSGLVHLLVISGTHILFLAHFLLALMLYLPLSRRSALLATNLLIFGFILLTGLQASALRAFVMALWSSFAEWHHRRAWPLPSFFFTVALLLFFQPLLLWYDVGFQLSAAATLGILAMTPRITLCLKRMHVPHALGNSFAVTLAATIATTPIIALYFRTIVFLGIIANLVAVPLVSIIMVYGLFLSFFTAISLPVMTIFALPLTLLLRGVIALASLFAHFPFATLQW